MLRARSLAIAVLALASLPPSRPAAADPTTDKNAAIEELMDWAEIYKQTVQEIVETGNTPDAYVFLVESGWEGVSAVAVKKQTVDAFIGYLQVENLLHPETLDQKIPKAAGAIGIDPWLVNIILEDRKAVLATGGAAAVHEKLRKLSDEALPQLQAYVDQLAAEANAMVKEAEEIGGLSSWPPTKDATTGQRNVFSPVEVGGVTVDYCLSFAADCGQPVADQFCQNNGYQKATSFEWQYMHPTRTLRSGESCDADYCGGFTKIVCE